MTGTAKISGTNLLEFWAGDPNKQDSGNGTISYKRLSNGLDIVGAGNLGSAAGWADRKLTLWAEGGTDFKGSIGFSGRFGQHINLNDANNGFGVQNGTVYSRAFDNFAWFSRGVHSNDALNPGTGGTLMASLSPGGYTLNIGKFTGDGSGLTNLNPNSLPNTYNYLGINGSNVIEFGRGVSGKSSEAGKIGYATYTPNTFEIVGAGSVTSGSDRKIKLWADGGLTIVGPTTASGGLPLGGNLIVGTNRLDKGSNHGVFASSFGDGHAVGSQDFTTYLRTSNSFSFYIGGTHDGGNLNARIRSGPAPPR